VATEGELLCRIAELEAELQQQRDAAERRSTIIEQMMRQMPALYWIVDRDLRIVGSGGETVGITGYARGSFYNETIRDVAAADPMSTDTIANHRRALAGETVKVETDYRGKLLATVIGPYRNEAGEIIGAIGTSIDVTPWRLLERRMIDAQRAESLGVLAGGLAHDFNNLLVAVIGNADLALRELGDGKSAHAVIDNIRVAGLRAAELTQQLLAFAGRGGAGTSRVEPAGIVEELLRILAPSIPTEVTVRVDIASGIAVRGDPAQLRQVLLNLLANARDALAGRPGHIAVRAEAQHVTGERQPHDMLTAPAGTYIVIEVEDDGPGMSDDTRRHVFEPFYTTKPTGHGLGLAAVLGIVRAHGGGIRVISTPGAGATFQILWPAAATAPMRAASPPPETSATGHTVLVIDDEPLVRDVVVRMVEDLGYAAVSCADGDAALALIAERSVDLALVDLSMPNMTGAELVEALRARRPDLPIVVCSGYDRVGKGPAGADAYLAKPFRIDALERTLWKLLPLRSV